MSVQTLQSPSTLPRQVHKKKERASPLRSVLAGSSAGAVEIEIDGLDDRSQPPQLQEILVSGSAFEYTAHTGTVAKTRTQLNQRLANGQKLPWPRFGAQWYAGCTTLIVGNSIKAGVRFAVFDQTKSILQDSDGKLSGSSTIIAGLTAGVFESVLAVTPFESIKTSLIDDQKSGKPRFRGLFHSVPIIARERGIRGFYQGLVPTTAKQSLNSATRFGSYEAFKRLALSHTKDEELGTMATFGIGGAAGIVTVYVTQPVDTIKTRMQSLEARALYSNSVHCAVRLVKEEGVLKLWSGAVPRLARLILSGGIVFSMYEQSMAMFERVDPEGKFV